MDEAQTFKLREAWQFINSSQRILLATHENPDGDGLASMLAVYFQLQSSGKEVFLFARGELPTYLRFLPGTELIKEDLPQRPFDLLIGFDYGDFKRLEIDDWLKDQPDIKILTFDHHPEGRQKGNLQVIDSGAASTTVLIHRLFTEARLVITPQIATCILSGIVVDTGGFRHSNVNSEALRVAGEMMLKGANLPKIVRETFRKKDLTLLRLWGEAIFRIRIDPSSGFVVSWVGADDLKKHGVERETMVEFSGLLNTVEGSRLAAFLSQEPDEAVFIKGSLRSEEYKGVDVSKVAAVFGGGGHKLASGFKIKSGWKEVIGKLVEEARRLANEKK